MPGKAKRLSDYPFESIPVMCFSIALRYCDAQPGGLALVITNINNDGVADMAFALICHALEVAT